MKVERSGIQTVESNYVLRFVEVPWQLRAKKGVGNHIIREMKK